MKESQEKHPSGIGSDPKDMHYYNWKLSESVRIYSHLYCFTAVVLFPCIHTLSRYSKKLQPDASQPQTETPQVVIVKLTRKEHPANKGYDVIVIFTVVNSSLPVTHSTESYS